MNVHAQAPHRQSASGSSRPKLPVLFHLIDVSRPRAAHPISEPSLDVQPPELQLAAASPIEPATTAAALPAVEFTSPPKVSAAVESTISIDPLPAPVETVPAPEAPLLPKPRSEVDRNSADRRRKTKRPATEDWFAAHGKYIALLFVLALGLTIYLARVNRRTKPVAEPPSGSLKVESGESSPKPTDSKPSATVLGDPSANLAASSTSSPAKLIETTSANAPQAELFPPTETQVAAKPSPDAARPTAGELFPQDKPQASRVGGPEHIVNHTLTSAGEAAAAPPSSAPAMAGAPAPALEPSYPHTGYPPAGLPAASYPATNPPVTTYPTTSYPPVASPTPPTVAMQPPANQPPPYQPTQFQPTQPPSQYQPTQPTQYQPSQYQATQFQPPVQQPIAPDTTYRSAFAPPPPGPSSPPPTWSPPPAGMPPSYQPPYNTVPGTRYERSGSGLY